MPALGQLLDRRLRPPPGAAAGVLAVPTAGDRLSDEVAPLFAELDQIEQRGELILAAACAEAAEIEASAERQRERLHAQARTDGERIAAELLAERRTQCERLARELLEDAERTATRVLSQGRERTPELAELVVSRLLAGGS